MKANVGVHEEVNLEKYILAKIENKCWVMWRDTSKEAYSSKGPFDL
jgi:hypothetical protein